MTTSRPPADERRRALLARPPRGSDGVDLLETDLERMLRGDPEAPAAVIAEATAAAIGAARRRGWVELPEKHFPAEGVPIPPVTWISAYGICRRAGARAALAALSHPPVLGLFGHEAWAAVARALIDPTAESVGAARAALRTAELDPVAENLLEIFAAGSRGDEDAVDVMALIGAAVVTGDRGEAVSWSLPPIGVGGGLVPPVRYRYPRARVRRAQEAEWFLDLEGFPRRGRAWAGLRCVARGGPGLAEAVLELAAPEDSGSASVSGKSGAVNVSGASDASRASAASTASAAPRASDVEAVGHLLDAGELVLAADLFAARAATLDDQPAARAWLAEAADCLAAARSCPPGPVSSERGRRVDPARLAPEHLATVERQWRRIVDDWDPAGPPLALLKLRLEPLLLAIAVDGTGVALRDVRPRPDDYAKVFTPQCRELARDRYERLWSGPIDFRHPDHGARVEIHLEQSSGSATLVAGRVWASWRYAVPGRTAGLFYDGLVWCDDHWTWFPKPQRLPGG